MDKKNSQILRLLFDPSTTEFVDWNKFLASQQFSEMSQDLADHFIKHGDFSHIKKILDQFRASQFFKPILLWFCNSAGLDFFFTGDELVLKRAEDYRINKGNFKSYITKYAGTAKDVSKEKALKVSISQDKDSPIPSVENDRKNLQRNEIVQHPTYGVALSKKESKKHKHIAHTPPQNQDSLKKTLKTATHKTTIRKIKDELRSDLNKLKGVPLKYQASVYAKMEREKYAQQDIKKREQMQSLRSATKKLKEELRKTVTTSVRAELERKIAACEKAIRNAPKPKRKWSPVLSGSFESGK